MTTYQAPVPRPPTVPTPLAATPVLVAPNFYDPRWQGLFMTSVLAGTALFTGSLVIAVLFTWQWGGDRTLLPLLWPFALILVCVAGSALAMSRSVRLAARVLEIGAITAITIGVLMFNGVGGSVPSLYILPIMLAGLLAGWREAVVVGGVALVNYLVAVVLQFGFRLQPPIEAGLSASLGIVVVLVVGYIGIFALVIFMISLATRAIDRSSHLAQQWANEMVGTNDQLVRRNGEQVQLSAELGAAAGELSITSKQQASGATEQASAVSQVSSTIEELGYTARQIAQSSEQVTESAVTTLEKLSAAQSAVDESIGAMERIKGRVQDVATRILVLGERSQQIGDIIDIIDDIADETHLLALNAAIEAAGAGEHGRRFAVVAAEVKNLANRSITAAKEVKAVIAEIQAATSASVLATEEGVKEVDRGAQLVTRSGAVMDTLVLMAERTVQAAQEISLATAQQQTASEQVVETMRDVADVARQTASGSRQMADAAGTLSTIAERLHGLGTR